MANLEFLSLAILGSRGEMNTNGRYHALDSLRAVMMLLGIWLHTVVGYSREGGWPYKDAHPTAIYNWTLGMIHTFRMPGFYMLAGFFGALLWYRRGPEGFAKNRLSRILLPFALFWAAMYPVVMAMAAYSRNWNYADGLARVKHFMLSGDFLRYAHPLHMWFLEYLLILYALAFAAATLLSRLPAAWLQAANRPVRWVLASPWRALFFAVPSLGTLALMPGGFLEDPPGFLPVPRIVLAYTVPVAFGWLLYLNRDLLPAFTRHIWTQLTVAGALFVAYTAFVAPHERNPALWPLVFWIRASAGAVAMWLLVSGLTGVFLRFYNDERPAMRYMSDASYWMYLIHMPVVMTLQMLLARLSWPAGLKVWICLALAVPALVLSYDLLVRGTWVGVLLNGRRYSRRFFVRREQSVAAAANTL